MKWRYATIVLLVLLFVAAVRVAVGVPRTPVPSVTCAGQVDIAMGLDGRLLVLIDEEKASQPSDGLVEQVFRLQNATDLAYSGPATVTYTRGRLTVQIGPDSGWVFNVAGRDLPAPDLALTAATVTGISHIWGDSIHKSPATLFSTLSSGSCSQNTAQSSLTVSPLNLYGGCSDCEAGGPGVSGCSINCGGGSSCDADCSSDSYACCNCPAGCGCCSQIVQH